MYFLFIFRLLNYRLGDGKGDLSFLGYFFKYKVLFFLSIKGRKERKLG